MSASASTNPCSSGWMCRNSVHHGVSLLYISKNGTKWKWHLLLHFNKLAFNIPKQSGHDITHSYKNCSENMIGATKRTMIKSIQMNFRMKLFYFVQFQVCLFLFFSLFRLIRVFLFRRWIYFEKFQRQMFSYELWILNELCEYLLKISSAFQHVWVCMRRIIMKIIM